MKKPKSPAGIRLESERPRWDTELRELWLGEKLVKRFETRASIQEWLLGYLEKQEWRSRILIRILPGRSKRPLQDRLHDVIVGLNNNQKDANIFFFRTGKGNEIGWELTPTHKKKPRTKV